MDLTRSISLLTAARLGRRGFLGRLAGAVAFGAGAVSATGGALAQDATPVGTPAPDGAIEAARGVVRYTHPEKVYFYLPGFQDQALVAGVYGLDVPRYRAIKAEFAAAARGAAAELLADDSFATRVDNLPFAPNATVAAIGDSFTDDLQSWFEILRHLLDLRRLHDRVRLVNLAVDSQTTTQAFGQLLPAAMAKPDWIFCLLGANDATRIGAEPSEPLVSLAETERNLQALRRFATAEGGARWIWLTRPPLDEARVDAFPPLRQTPLGPIAWRNADAERLNAFLSRQPEPVVDTRAAFGNPVASDLLEPDGLHPSLAGQTLIAKGVVERLTA